MIPAAAAAVWAEGAGSPGLIAFIAAAFVLGGFVKGTLGVGLPLITVPLLSLAMPSHRAIALVVMPVLFSNAWQAWDSKLLVRELRRFVALIVPLVIATMLTVRLTLGLTDRALSQMLAAAVLVAVALMAWQPTLQVSPRREGWWGAGVGLASGVLGGVSSLTGPLIISYLMALRLPRETFVGVVSVIYLSAALPLYGSMAWHGRIGWGDVLLSMLALLPVWGGLLVGRALRSRLGETGFRRLLLAFLSALAMVLMLK